MKSYKICAKNMGYIGAQQKHRIEVITGAVDVLQKVCAVVEYIKDQTSKGMASEKQ